MPRRRGLWAMAMLILPGQLSARSEFYHQIGSSLSAGLTLVRTLRMISESPPSAGLGGIAEALVQRLEVGATFSEAIRSLGRWAPAFDIALIESGESGGRLDAVCKVLSKNYQERARLSRQILLGVFYPVVLFHFAFLILPINAFLELFKTWDFTAFAIHKAAIFVPIYGIVAAIILAAGSEHGGAWRSTLERLFLIVPVFGKARRALVLSRLSLALDSLLNAGVPSTRAWPMAAAASGSPAIGREVDRLVPRLSEGESAGDFLLRSRVFPQHFVHVYATAELSGRTDEALGRLAAHYQDEGVRMMGIAAMTLTGLIYATVLIVVAYQIISFWLGYYSQILDIQ